MRTSKTKIELTFKNGKYCLDAVYPKNTHRLPANLKFDKFNCMMFWLKCELDTFFPEGTVSKTIDDLEFGDENKWEMK